MACVVRGVFGRPEDAQSALDQMIQLGFRQDQIAFRSRFVASDVASGPSLLMYDSVGAALLSERILTSMSTTGYNLAGNSTLSGTRLGDIGRILEEVADAEEGRPGVRIDVMVRTDDRHSAETAEGVLTQAGAQNIHIKERNQ